MIRNWQVVFSRIRTALMRRGRSRQDADDLVQEAWLRLVAYKEKHEVKEAEAFLMRAALNLSIDGHRARHHHGEQLVLDEVHIMDTSASVEDILLAREQIMKLSECLADLNARTRSIFLAHRLDGLTYQEIAQDMRLSVSAVEKHVAKATLIVTREMQGWWP